MTIQSESVLLAVPADCRSIPSPDSTYGTLFAEEISLSSEQNRPKEARGRERKGRGELRGEGILEQGKFPCACVFHSFYKRKLGKKAYNIV